MNRRLESVFLAAISAAFSFSVIADDTAGHTKSAACSACHGANGISISDGIPNLAGQKSKYLMNQLNAFRDEKRMNPLMNAIAAQLSETDIEELAEFFSALPVESESESGELAALLDPTLVKFPDNYKDDSVQYTTANRADNKQVRYLYANAAAMEGAEQGAVLPDGSVIVMEVFKAKLDADQKPVVGGDGFYEKDSLAGFAVMEKVAGFGDKVPEALRNSNWRYAFFTADKKHRDGINQAACLACHKPLDSDDYLFSASALRAFAAK